MLLNLSNHPSSRWPDYQISMAKQEYGEILDMEFPRINPHSDESEILSLADEYLHKIQPLKPKAVHLMGELTFSFCLIHKLKLVGIPCLASTTDRITQELPDGTKMSKFEFVKFRFYKV